MALAPVYIDPLSASFLTANIPEVVHANGTNFPVDGLAFGVNLSEAAYFRFRAVDYAGGSLLVDCDWYTSATSGTVTWGAAIAAITLSTDNVSMITDGLATENTNNGTAASNANRGFRTTVTVTNLDSLAADDSVTIRIRRTDNGAAADVVLFGLTIRE